MGGTPSQFQQAANQIVQEKKPGWQQALAEIKELAADLGENIVETVGPGINGALTVVGDSVDQLQGSLAETGSGLSYAATDAIDSAGFPNVAKYTDKAGDFFREIDRAQGEPKTAVGRVVREAPGELLSFGGKTLMGVGASTANPLLVSLGGALNSVTPIATYGNSYNDQKEKRGKENINRVIPMGTAIADAVAIDPVSRVLTNTASNYVEDSENVEAIEKFFNTGEGKVKNMEPEVVEEEVKQPLSMKELMIQRQQEQERKERERAALLANKP